MPEIYIHFEDLLFACEAKKRNKVENPNASLSSHKTIITRACDLIKRLVDILKKLKYLMRFPFRTPCSETSNVDKYDSLDFFRSGNEKVPWE